MFFFFHFDNYTAESGNMVASRKVAQATFRKWRLEEEFETTKRVIDGSVFITKVTCKICHQYKLNIPRDPQMRGVEKANVSAFVDGTQQVTKHSLTRQVSGRVSSYNIKLNYLFS